MRRTKIWGISQTESDGERVRVQRNNEAINRKKVRVGVGVGVGVPNWKEGKGGEWS